MVVALLGIEISIIALASAASATSPGEAPKSPPPVTRTYAIGGGDIHTGHWFTATDPPEVDLTRVKTRRTAVRISHGAAINRLRDAGLRWKSSGGCANRRLHHCTSLQSVRTATIAKIIDLKRDSGCTIMVTGGTEAGHMPGRYSHEHGYKLDISLSPCIDRHITTTHPRVGTRYDGSPLYKSSDGTIFAKEPDHWDILFR
ncbi:hypothetical protein [Nonomuraea typhae]|uniref:Uncharacterized protein n=1 Tax=Nonomuraea typhae TaxID=2603600 RepID=A0ABW7YXM7_9ACTN